MWLLVSDWLAIRERTTKHIRFLLGFSGFTKFLNKNANCNNYQLLCRSNALIAQVFDTPLRDYLLKNVRMYS